MKNYRLSGLHWASAFGTLLLFLLLIYKVFISVIDVPFWDEWNWVYLFEKLYTNSLRFSDVWASYGIHRNVFPRLFMLMLGWMTRWDIRAEVVSNIMMAILTFGIILQLVRRIFPVKSRSFAIGLPLLGLTAFSLVQYENWVIGGNTVIFMTMLFFVLGMYVLSQEKLTKLKFWLAILCGIITSFCCGLGPAYWIAGGWMLYERQYPFLTKGKDLVIWTLVTLSTVFLYIWGNTGLQGASAPITPSTLLSSILYILIYIGRPITALTISHVDLMILGGIGALGTTCVFLFLLKTRYQNDWQKFLPFISFMIFVFCNAAVTSFGRATMGLVQAGSSRYTTVTNVFWISWTVMLVYIIKRMIKDKKHTVVMSLVVVGVISMTLSIMSTIRSEKEFASFHTRFVLGRQKLLQGQVCVKEVYGESSPCKLKEVEILKRFNLSLFRTKPEEFDQTDRFSL